MQGIIPVAERRLTINDGAAIKLVQFITVSKYFFGGGRNDNKYQNRKGPFKPCVRCAQCVRLSSFN